MSGPSHGHDHGGGASDAVRYDKVIIVGVASLAIFALSIAWAGKLMHDAKDRAEAKSGRARVVELDRKEIGIVDQVPFVSDTRLKGWRADRAWQLGHYGWVDKQKGVVRMPIEAAMDKVAGGAMPAGAPK
jgi:hypothetical protein